MKGRNKMKGGKGSTVGKKTGVKAGQKQMLQHDRKIRSKGSVGYADKVTGYSAPKRGGSARRLKDVPL